jgi:hypothetical protein
VAKQASAKPNWSLKKNDQSYNQSEELCIEQSLILAITFPISLYFKET